VTEIQSIGMYERWWLMQQSARLSWPRFLIAGAQVPHGSTATEMPEKSSTDDMACELQQFILVRQAITVPDTRPMDPSSCNRAPLSLDIRQTKLSVHVDGGEPSEQSRDTTGVGQWLHGWGHSIFRAGRRPSESQVCATIYWHIAYSITFR
jgi:hypothetical protein